MDELKNKVVQFIQTRIELEEREASVMADHILDVHRQILAGVKPEKVLQHIERFLNDFTSDIHIIEQRNQQKSKQNSYAEKRRTQLDIFSAASDQP
ncbi:hypothetical protein F9K33_15145 [bacterium]|nr:MAG: hypothetical protein F9K33_15145 [bacterium]